MMFRFSDIARSIVRERQAKPIIAEVKRRETIAALQESGQPIPEELLQGPKKPLRFIDDQPSFHEARRTLAEMPGMFDHRLEQAGRGAKAVGKVVSPVARGGAKLARRVGQAGLEKIKQVIPERQPKELPQVPTESPRPMPLEMHEVRGGAILRITDPTLKAEIERKIRPDKAAFRGDILMQVGPGGDYVPFNPDDAKALAGAFSSLEVQPQPKIPTTPSVPQRSSVEQPTVSVPPIVGRDVAGGVELVINNPQIQQLLREKINPDVLTLRGNVVMAKDQGQPRPLTVNEAIRLRKEISSLLQNST